MKFYKLNGIGNDYIFLYLPELQLDIKDYSALAVRLSDRHTGIGGDGLILVDRLSQGFSMRIFNSDGSEAEICGNALRALGLLLKKKHLMRASCARIYSPSGIHEVRLLSENGNYATLSAEMPMPKRYAGVFHDGYSGVNVGNLHAVKIADAITESDLREAASLSKSFAGGINAEVATINADGSVSMRVFERGSGETLACGSGAVAVTFVCRALGKLSGESVAVHLLGGTLEVKFSKDKVILIGGAAFNFEGEITL